MTLPTELEALDAVYQDKLKHFDQGAVRRKWRYQALWITITALTFFNLIVAAVSEHFGHETWFQESYFGLPLVNLLFPAIGLSIILLTIFQTGAGLQGQWLAYRGAAERLRRNAMLFRAGLPPFDVGDAVAGFQKVMEEICLVADRQDPGEAARKFSWRQAWALWNMPQETGRVAASAPDQGLSAGPFREPVEIIDGRLHNQRKWYLKKARAYFRNYLTIQVGIVACSVVNILHPLLFGGHRQYWLVLVSSTMSLGLIACRDFLDWGPLFVRYLQTATNLKNHRGRLRDPATAFDLADDRRDSRRSPSRSNRRWRWNSSTGFTRAARKGCFHEPRAGPGLPPGHHRPTRRRRGAPHLRRLARGTRRPARRVHPRPGGAGQPPRDRPATPRPGRPRGRVAPRSPPGVGGRTRGLVGKG